MPFALHDSFSHLFNQCSARNQGPNRTFQDDQGEVTDIGTSFPGQGLQGLAFIS